jgi:NAD(P)-dependent dehydrogenase (short-subunit alcohol dehydrogenase family)
MYNIGTGCDKKKRQMERFSMRFSNKTAVVTGGGNGIGKAVALAFAAEGANVLVVDQDANAAIRVARDISEAGGASHYCVADVSKGEDVEKYVRTTLERFGRIDAFFNNAGIEGDVAPIWEYNPETFLKVMSVNCTGVFLGLRYVLPVMIKQRSGRIVNTASVASLSAAPGMTAYVASKHAVLGLTKCAATEAAQFGLNINAICPGPVNTQLAKRVHNIRSQSMDPHLMAALALQTPSRRGSTVEEIAKIALFLCSADVGNMNGEYLVSDGGRASALAPWVERPN